MIDQPQSVSDREIEIVQTKGNASQELMKKIVLSGPRSNAIVFVTSIF